MSKQLDNLLRQWTQIGAGFSAEPDGMTPDLERLLLDTARHAHEMARLFIMAATWLHRYGDLIAKHRLKRLIREELEPEYRPVLGLLFDIAQQRTHPLEFQSVLKTINPAEHPRPLFSIEASNERLARRAQRKASDISRRWNLWCSQIDFKFDAIRPAHWIMRRNSGLIIRGDLRGDLRASVLASLRFDPGAGTSEVSLAEASGGSRAQVRNALDNLELTGRVRRLPNQGEKRRRTAVELARSPARSAHTNNQGLS